MTIEESILEWLAEAQKWCKVDSRSIIIAHEELYNAEQVMNALRRLKRARRIVYDGPRSRGFWRTAR